MFEQSDKYCYVPQLLKAMLQWMHQGNLLSFFNFQKWLIEQRQQCPHCRTPLRVNQLVNVRFADEVTAAIDTLEAKTWKSKEVCVDHDNTPKTYYCNTCKMAICSDCAMFTAEHKSHEFEKLQVVYQRHVDAIKQETGCLLKRLQELSDHVRET